MKTTATLLAIATTIISAATTYAEDAKPKTTPAPVSAVKPETGTSERLKQFDKNGNGIIDPEERVELQKQATVRRDELIKKYDKDGDGKLSEAERKTLQAERGLSTPAADARRQELTKKFDLNGDGVVDATERQTGLKAIQERQQSVPTKKIERGPKKKDGEAKPEGTQPTTPAAKPEAEKK